MACSTWGGLYGDYAEDFDTEAITGEYRDLINEALPPGFYLAGEDLYGPYPVQEHPDVRGIADSIDLTEVLERHRIK